MSLIINKVSSCSTQINYSYLESDLLFGYDVVGNYTIEFADISFTDSTGVLYEGIEALRQAYQQPNLVARIGTDEFTNGRLTSQSFEQSNLVGSSSCTVTIEDSKRLNDYSNNEFAEHIPSPHWISAFQETFSFSRSGDNYSSTRNVSLTYKQDAGNQFLNNAKLFLSNIYNDSRPNFGYHIDGISENGRFNENFRPLISETIDLLNLSVSIQESVQTSFIENDYSKKESVSTEIGEDGFVSKKYTIEIKALREPLEKNALEACKQILDDIINQNIAEFKDPIEIGKGINRDGSTISLNISFSNDPKLNSDNPTTYTVTESRSGNFYEYAITFDLQSNGKNKEEKLANLRSAYSSNAVLNLARINNLFSIGDIYLKSTEYSISSKEPKITNTTTYTEDPSYNTSGDILKDENTLSIKNPLQRHKIFVSPENKAENVEVAGNLKSSGTITYTRNVVTKMSAKINGLINILENTEPETDKLSSDIITANLECVGSRVSTNSTTE
jgi:hypothetical protein